VWTAWLVRLAAEGRVTLAAGGKPIGMRPRVRLKSGATLSRTVIEDRR
jgi:hypothetical protein